MFRRDTEPKSKKTDGLSFQAQSDTFLAPYIAAARRNNIPYSLKYEGTYSAVDGSIVEVKKGFTAFFVTFSTRAQKTRFNNSLAKYSDLNLLAEHFPELADNK